MKNSSDRKSRLPPVTLCSPSTSLRNTNASSTNSAQTAAPNNQQVAASSSIPNNIALLQEKDSLEKSSNIPLVTHATSVIKQDAHEGVEDTIKFTLFSF
jgi:hypothetical protein